jgi:cytochrome c peroxidase
MQTVVRGKWMRAGMASALAGLVLAIGLNAGVAAHEDEEIRHDVGSGRRLFERETFGGNGRTCLTCHSRRTGTVSPEEAQERFARDPNDPLFRGDGSDDGNGNGVQRMLADATVLVRVPLAENVSLANDPTARSVVVRRGISTTLNSPSLDPVLMLDGRQPSLEAQAKGAIVDHASAPYFHDNSAKTLADVVEHYAKFFAIVSTPPGGAAPALVLSEQDKADILAYMKLLR